MDLTVLARSMMISVALCRRTYDHFVFSRPLSCELSSHGQQHWKHRLSYTRISGVFDLDFFFSVVALPISSVMISGLQ